jgi:choline-sulfatase
MATGMHDFSDNRLPGNIPTLAALLQEHSYQTAAFVSSAVLDSRFGLNRGFSTYYDHFDFDKLYQSGLDTKERSGDQTAALALNWLKKRGPTPFFLWVHLYDPHYPYIPPPPYSSIYRNRPYDGEIAFADAQVGRLLAALKEQGLFDRTLVVIAGDHGEGLGEHGEKTHGFFIYNSTLHVPLIIEGANLKPRVVQEPVSLVDVMPTILQALAIPVPDSVQGRSLWGLALGHSSGSHSNLYAETYLPLLHFRWNQLRGLQRGAYQYIDAPRPELYNLHNDPRELKNLYQGSQSSARELQNQLDSLIRRFTPAGNATASRTMTDPALMERLRSLGYVAVSAGTFAEANGTHLPDPKDRIRIYNLVTQAMEDQQRGENRESVELLRAAAQTEKKSSTIEYLMAMGYYRMKDYNAAMGHFEACLREDPKLAMASYYLGLCQVATGQMEAAAQSFSQSFENDPTSVRAAYNLGAALVKMNRIPAAAKAFDQCIQLQPTYAPAYEALGQVELYENMPDAAVDHLRKAVQLAPESRSAHYHLAQAYAAKGMKAEAEKEYDLARRP